MLPTFAAACGVILVASAIGGLWSWWWSAQRDRTAEVFDDEPPTEQFPVVPREPVPWEARQAGFALYVKGYAERAERIRALLAERERGMNTPTAEYKVVVAENFGVALAVVGPREADLPCVRTVGLPVVTG